MKEDLLSRSNRFFASLGGWSYDHRWWVVAFAVMMLLGSLNLASRVQFDNSFEAYFDQKDPSYQQYLDYRDRFGSDEVAYIAYRVPRVELGPWDIEVMRKLVSLTESLENEVPFIYEVQSLANAELMVGNADGVEILEIRDEFPETQAELLVLRERFLAKPMMVDGLLSKDAEHGAIMIRMDRTSTDPLEEIRLDPDGGDDLGNLYPQVTDLAIKEILARSEYEDFVFYYTGDVPLNAELNTIVSEESAQLGLVTAFVVALVLLFFFRSAVGVIAPTVVVQMGVVMTVALMVILGWKMGLMFAGIPTLMTAIGVAHSVHILSEFRALFAELGDRREALVQTLSRVGTPALLSSITTAVGFGSMSVVPIKSLAQMGLYSAFGVMAIFVLSLTLLMALLSFGSRTPSQAFSQKQIVKAKGGLIMISFLERVHGFVIKRRVAVLIGSLGVITFAVVGVFLMKVDSNWLNDFSESHPVRKDTIYVDENMGGGGSLILVFDGETQDAVKNPAVLEDITRIENWAHSQPLLRKSNSISGIIRDLNQTFNEDDPAFYRVPTTRDLIAQYMILYESAGGTDASRYVSTDYQATQLEFRTTVDMTSKFKAVIDELETELQENPLQASSLQVTGVMGLWLKLLDYVVVSQVRGFLLAFTAIALILLVVFRSFRIGFIAMLPNVLPALLTLGIMGWLDIPLDYNKVMIGAVAMGIAVDDTVHLLTRFRYEFLRRGNYEAALRAALLDVGRALVITSIALVLGFLVLLASILDSKANQGVLLAGTIVTALVADFLLMPALVLSLKPFGKEIENDEALTGTSGESVFQS